MQRSVIYWSLFCEDKGRSFVKNARHVTLAENEVGGSGPRPLDLIYSCQKNFIFMTRKIHYF